MIRKFFERLTKVDKKILGRWNINYCEKITNKKIDRSNEDHCGPCGYEKNLVIEKHLKKSSK